MSSKEYIDRDTPPVLLQHSQQCAASVKTIFVRNGRVDVVGGILAQWNALVVFFLLLFYFPLYLFDYCCWLLTIFKGFDYPPNDFLNASRSLCVVCAS